MLRLNHIVVRTIIFLCHIIIVSLFFVFLFCGCYYSYFLFYKNHNCALIPEHTRKTNRQRKRNEKDQNVSNKETKKTRFLFKLPLLHTDTHTKNTQACLSPTLVLPAHPVHLAVYTSSRPSILKQCFYLQH